MIEIKTLGGGLNMDDSQYRLPPNDYIAALNITHDAVEGSNDQVITPIIANRQVPYSYPVYLTSNTTLTPFGDITFAQTVFAGMVSPNLIINVYLTRLSDSEQILAGTYTTVEGDTFGDIITGLVNSLIILDIVSVPSRPPFIALYIIDNTLYSFNRVDILDFGNKCIGSYVNTLRNTTINFIFSPSGHHVILEFNKTTRTITKIFENLTDSGDIDILGFTEFGLIKNIDVYNRDEGDLLFFLDSLGRPTEMDITLFKAGTYTPVTRVIIDKAKKPFLSPPSVVYGNDTARRSNNLRNKLFRFKTRPIYDDFEKGTFSPISVVALSANILSDTYTNIVTNNNVIRMVSNTGDKNVKSIEIAMSYVEKTNDWSDFQSVTVIEKSSLSLTQLTQVVFSDGMTVTNNTIFTGNVSAGTIVNAYLTTLPSTNTLVGTYTVLGGDTTTSIATGLALSMASLGIVTGALSFQNNVLYSWVDATYDFDEVEIINSNVDNDNIDFPYSFYNDSTYPTIDVEESIELFDYVPLKANAQALLNGNTLAYIGITEGYNKDTVENATITVGTVPAGSGGTDGALYGVNTSNISGSSGTQANFTLNGIPVVGTVVEAKVKRLSDHTIIVASTYTTVAGDTTVSVVQKLIDNQIPVSGLTVGYYVDRWVLSVFVNYLNYEPITGSTYVQLIITPPGIDAGASSIATWKWSTERNIARAYFDVHGVTNGVLYTDKVTFPAYAENGSSQPLVPFINYKINDIPPIWAYSVNFYMTKEGTQYIFWESFKVNKSESEYIYFDVSSFTTNATRKPTTATVLSYTFQDGDRVRVIRDSAVPGTVFNDTYDAYIEGLVVDPIISLIPQTGTFLKVKNVEPLTSGILDTLNYVLEIYRPAQQASNPNNQVYYEFGQQFDIIDPTLPTRRHSGQVTDQVVGATPAEFNFYQGDAYFRSRTIAVGDAGYQTFNVMDRNFVDFFISAVSSVDGRPNIIDINARQAYYSTLIRHGEAYEANTNINGLNRFFAKNFDEYPINHGDALAIIMKDKELIVMQKFKIGHVALFSSIGKDANGLTVIFNTDKLLNPIQYYVGDFGIGTCPESIASFNYAIYGCDNIKGIIWRLSLDGLVALSIKYKANSWANDNLILRTGNYKILGAFDQRLNNYIGALDAINGSPAQTFVWDEEANRFESFISLFPEMMVTLGTTLIAFKNGQLWTHDDDNHYNNFFGVQYNSYITPVFNKLELDKKTFIAVEEIASQAWDCPEIITGSNAYGSTKQISNLIVEDFEELEGNFNAAFLGASNSIGGIINGDSLKGNLMSVQFRAIIPEPPNNLLVSLALLKLKAINSALNVDR